MRGDRWTPRDWALISCGLGVGYVLIVLVAFVFDPLIGNEPGHTANHLLPWTWKFWTEPVAVWVSGLATTAAVLVALRAPGLQDNRRRQHAERSSADVLRVIVAGAEVGLDGFLNVYSESRLASQSQGDLKRLRVTVTKVLSRLQRHAQLISQLSFIDAAKVLAIENALETVIEQIDVDADWIMRTGTLNTSHVAKVKSLLGAIKKQCNDFTHAIDAVSRIIEVHE